MRAGTAAIAVLVSMSLATYPLALAGWSTALLLIGVAGVLLVAAALALGRPVFAAAAGLAFLIEYGAALIVENVALDVYAVVVAFGWLILNESVERASLLRGGVVIDPTTATRRRRFLQLELSIGGVAAAVVLGAGAAVDDSGDPFLFTLGVGSAALVATVVVRFARRSVDH